MFECLLCLINDEVVEIIVHDEVIVAVVDFLEDHRFQVDSLVDDEVDDEAQGADKFIFGVSL